MATPSVRLDRGEALPLAYTPGAAVTAGDVVVQGDLIAVAPRDIAASVLGNLLIVGPLAVFIFPKETGTGTALTVGTVVYWAAAASASSVKINGIADVT